MPHLGQHRHQQQEDTQEEVLAHLAGSEGNQPQAAQANQHPQDIQQRKVLPEDQDTCHHRKNRRRSNDEGAVGGRLCQLDAIGLTHEIDKGFTGRQRQEFKRVLPVDMDVVSNDNIVQQQQHSRHQHPYIHEILDGDSQPQQAVVPDVRHSPEDNRQQGNRIDRYFFTLRTNTHLLKNTTGPVPGKSAGGPNLHS